MLQILIVSALFAVPFTTLECWNCVGKDCDVMTSNSHNWELVTCPEGSVCQKTDFVFYSNRRNETRTSHTVRSCSYENGCTWSRSRSCRKSPVLFAGRGCTDRFCCAKDKCNGNNNKTLRIWMSLVVTLIFIIFSCL